MWLCRVFLGVVALYGLQALAHEVNPQDIAALRQQAGASGLVMMTYLGAKHMVTGVDHVLFLCGVMFLLRRWSDIVWFASLFALGHTLTLLGGSLLGLGLNAYLTDFVIGFSVFFKGLENLLTLRKQSTGLPPRLAVFGFGLIHGLGLASRVESLQLAPQNLVAKIVAFNVGVEIGQLLALAIIIVFVSRWQATATFRRQAYAANLALVAAGTVLMVYQGMGFLLQP